MEPHSTPRLLVASFVLACACGSGQESSSPAGTGGTDATGGASGTGGTDATGGASGTGGTDATVDAGTEGPLYFIAIHNEPWHFSSDGKAGIASEFEVLREMVAKADDVNVKLTLMFTAQWADYIVESAPRHDEVRAWKAKGHEIAAHHHSVYHGNWDGYTDYTEAEAIAHRLKSTSTPESYIGTLDAYSARIALLDPDVVSGCMNDEPDMRELPKSILFDTCLGYANRGDDWFAEEDGANPEKGINEFVTIGQWAGVQRAWLAYYQITKPEKTTKAKATFDSMQEGVYGVVLHSSSFEAPELYSYLAFLQERDPGGTRSRTVREVIENAGLPTRTVPAEHLETKLTPQKEGLCGDDVCDAAEQANPSLCPEDCAQSGPCGDGTCDAAEQADPNLCPQDCP